MGVSLRERYSLIARRSIIKPIARCLLLFYKANSEVQTVATYPEYVHAAMRAAQYEQLESGEWVASIPQLSGLWGMGPTIEDARADLCESLPDWIDVHIKIGKHTLPEINGISIYKPFDPAE